MPFPFDPEEDLPQNQQADQTRPPPLGQQMAGNQAAMQPPATPEEHAANKQSWLDFFNTPQVSNALLQFSANILQPRYHQSEAGMIGGALGAAGEAVGRVGEQQMQQQKMASDTEEAQARAGYYKAQSAMEPQKLQLQIDKLQNMNDVNQMRLQLQGQLDAAKNDKNYAQVQWVQSQMDMLELKKQQLQAGGIDPGAKAKYVGDQLTNWDLMYGQSAKPGERDAARQKFINDYNSMFSNTPGATGAGGTGTGSTTAAAKPRVPVPIDQLNNPNVQKQLAQLPEKDVKQSRQLYVNQYGEDGGKKFDAAYNNAMKQFAPVTPPGQTAPPGQSTQPAQTLEQKNLQQLQQGGHL
jgi:hypothetical protein